ncbi:MAG: hypothetical protein ACI81R_000727 [Bradymonadia bacterium]|jgi:hypothetical protein
MPVVLGTLQLRSSLVVMSDGSNEKDPERRSPGDDTGVGLDVDRVLAAAGLDAPGERGELDLYVDFKIDEMEESELAERLPFRFATTPVDDKLPSGSSPAAVNPFANTINEPSMLGGGTVLDTLPSVDEANAAPDPKGGTHLQVAEMLQSRMKKRGYTPIGTPSALNAAPSVIRDASSSAPAAQEPRLEQVATRDVGVVPLGADAFDTREVLVQAPDPFEEDVWDDEIRPDVQGNSERRADKSACVEEYAPGDSRLPTPAGVATAADETQPLDNAPPEPGVPLERATRVLDDLPVEALARQRRASVSKSKKSDRRRVRHGEDQRVLGRASLGAREVAGVKEERNTARDRSVEALLREYVESPVEPVPSADAEGPVPGAQVFKRRRRR